VLEIVVSAVVGLLVGSFANVVIHRVPANESIVRPSSRCPSCGEPISSRDNVPVVSWLVLRGRCRHCGAPISARYPAVELTTAGLFALTAWRLERGTDLIAYLPLVWVLVVLSAIDIEHKLLPNRIVLPAVAAMLVLLAVAAALGPGWGEWVRALAAGAASFAGFLVLVLIAPRGMGMGDVKLAGLLGLGLGYVGWGNVFVGFFVAFLAGSVGGLALVAARRTGMKAEIPFGPYLALGTLVGILWGEAIRRIWLGD
jgi:leader peptidase (prepilin peptidase)/N-methyltransferase